MLTIQRILDTAIHHLALVSDSAGLDAEVLLAFCLGKNRSYLRAWNDKKLDESTVERFNVLIAQRLNGIPIAYLTGVREFWSREFLVSPDVLIPRPDTEMLIEHCLIKIPLHLPVKILDLGTGSGIIAITLAAERPNAEIIAVDKSYSALKIAQQNALLHDCSQIKFVLSDWFSALPDLKFDFIVSNPPYISTHDVHLTKGDVRFEPSTALIADEGGLRDIRFITEHAKKFLVSKGYLLFEHGYNQDKAVQNILKTFDFKDIQTHADLAGNPRITIGC